MGSRALSCGVTSRSPVVTPVTPQTRGKGCPAGMAMGLGGDEPLDEHACAVRQRGKEHVAS
jgi:hypothetical protein